jgi:hypothetical protein
MSAATITLKISTSGFSDISATLSPEYTGINGGRYDLPEGLGDPTPVTVDIPFGSVSAANLVYAKNMSGQDLAVTLDGVLLDDPLPHGKAMSLILDGLAVFETLSFTTTAAIAGADRHIEYRIAGDPA